MSRTTIAVIANSISTAVLFRKQLFKELIAHGWKVVLYVPATNPKDGALLTSIGVQCRKLNIGRSASGLVQDFLAARQLVRALRVLQPQIVLCTFLKPVIFGSLAAWRAGVPSIYSMIEGMGFAFTRKGKQRGVRRSILRAGVVVLLRAALRRNRGVFVLNEDDEQQIRRLNVVRPSQIVRIDGIGVDLEEFAPSAVPLSPFRFLFIGRLLKEKGLVEFAQAAGIVKREYPEAECQILGGLDTNPGALSRDQVEGWQRSGKVEWLGTRSDVAAVIRQSSVFVLPSYREGKPKSTMEAMASGRAVITTDVPGCRETVVDGENGLLVAPHDSEALAAAMRKFLQQPELAVEMGKRSAQMAAERFDVHVINAQILDVLGVEDGR